MFGVFSGAAIDRLGERPETGVDFVIARAGVQDERLNPAERVNRVPSNRIGGNGVNLIRAQIAVIDKQSIRPVWESPKTPALTVA